MNTYSVITNMSSVAQSYHKLGFTLVPFPSGSKGPMGTAAKGWQLRENCIGPGQSFPSNMSMGLAHAYSRTCAIDIDDMALAISWGLEHGIDIQGLLNDPSNVQIVSGVSNHGKLIFRLPPEQPSLPTVTFTNNKKHMIQFRCATRRGTTMQDVLPPSIHPDTGKPYQWKGDYTQIPELPAPLYQLWLSKLETTEHIERKGDIQTSEAEIESALATIDPDVDRNQWVRIGMAIHAADPAFYHLFLDWSSNGLKFAGAHDTEAVWASFNQISDGVTPLTLFKLARESGWKGYRRPADEVFKPAAAQVDMFTSFVDTQSQIMSNRGDGGGVNSSVNFGEPEHPVPKGFWESVDVAHMVAEAAPVLETLVTGLVPMNVVTGLVGPPGHGKSNFLIELGWSMVTGRALFGNPTWQVRHGSIFVLEAEDDRGECHRRIQDLARHDPEGARAFYGSAARMYYHFPAGADIRLTDRYGNPTALVDRLITEIRSAPTRILCFAVGPLINLSGGSESNEDTQAVLTQLERIAHSCGCAVVAPHHTSKDSALRTDRSEYAARGGSSFTGSVRAQIHIQNMGAGEAEQYQVSEDGRHQWVGISLPKASGMQRQEEPVWLRRRENSATMAWVPDQPVKPFKERDDKKLHEYRMVIDKAREILSKAAAPFPLRAFSKEYGGTQGVFGIGENALRAYLVRGCEDGLLRHNCTVNNQSHVCRDLLAGDDQEQPKSLKDTGTKYQKDAVPMEFRAAAEGLKNIEKDSEKRPPVPSEHAFLM